MKIELVGFKFDEIELFYLNSWNTYIFKLLKVFLIWQKKKRYILGKKGRKEKKREKEKKTPHLK